MFKVRVITFGKPCGYEWSYSVLLTTAKVFACQVCYLYRHLSLQDAHANVPGATSSIHHTARHQTVTGPFPNCRVRDIATRQTTQTRGSHLHFERSPKGGFMVAKEPWIAPHSVAHFYSDHVSPWLRI